MAKTFFISSTGTNIGKTVVTCSLIRQLKELNKDIYAIKPVITGWDSSDLQSDTLQILLALGIENNTQNILNISPWKFKAALAPSMAAKIESQEINYSKLIDFCKNTANKYEYLFCEGAGGVAVPLTKNKTTLNLVQDLEFPVILVAGSYLGSISHTITAVKTLESSGIAINSIIVNESVDSIGLNETISELNNFIDYPIYPLKRVANTHNAWKETNNIIESLNLAL